MASNNCLDCLQSYNGREPTLTVAVIISDYSEPIEVGSAN